MKKLAIAVAAMVLMPCAFAQKANVKKAQNALYPPIDITELTGASKAIEEAMVNTETMNNAETFKVAGDVFYNIQDQEINKRMTGGTASQSVITENTIKAADAYIKAYVLDQQPDAKGKLKPKYDKDIKKQLADLRNKLIGIGNDCYNVKDYKGSFEAWSKYIDVCNSEAMKSEPDELYTDIYFYNINAAMLGGASTEETIKLMEGFKNVDYKESATVYEWLYGLYQKSGDTEKSIALLKEGAQKFPQSSYFTGTLINYYINGGQTEEAIKYLDEMIAKNPNDPQYYNVKGNTLRSIKRFDDAIAAHKRATEIDPKNADAFFNMGLAYVGKARGYQKEMEALPLKGSQKKYEELKLKMAKEFENSIDPLEAARAIKPNDRQILELLRSSYYNINNGTKAAEIKKIIDSLPQE